MGSLAKVDYGALASIAPVMVVSMAAVLVMRWRINVLSLGDHEAKALGVNLKVERGVVIFFATLLTASAVSPGGRHSAGSAWSSPIWHGSSWDPTPAAPFPSPA